MIKFAERVFEFLCSIKLAVIVILGLAAIASVGTIYEARYDATVARKLVYQSPYMYAVMILLAINLIAVMIDRWPWKRRHLSFLFAHVGIILLLAGGLITQKIGVDGNVAFGIGESNRYAQVDDFEFGVYSSFDGNNIAELARRPVDFFMRPPKQYPMSVSTGDGESVEVVDYYHFANRNSEMLASDRKEDGPAVRIQLQNPNVNLSRWIRRDKSRPSAEISLGPANVILSESEFTPPEGNFIVLVPEKDYSALKFKIFTRSKGGLTASGVIREAEVVETGWMGIKLRVIQILPRAQEKISFAKVEKPTPASRPAVLIRYKGREHWIGLNSMAKFFADKRMIMVTFSNRRVDLGFNMKLSRFNVGHYQGTNRAASYESEVEVPGLGTRTISMNHPLDYNGYTFYQASFESDEMGKPAASILSVNYDPGRWLKYLGSLMVVMGATWMFWFRRKAARVT